jgi:hypothetical protein
MRIETVLGIVLFGAAMTCMVLSGLVTFAMIGEINRKVPEEDRISYLGGGPDKPLHLYREYRRLYPDGRLHRLLVALLVCMMVLLAFVAWWLRNFGGPPWAGGQSG